jgi:cytochrome c biogenesis protein CcdA
MVIVMIAENNQNRLLKTILLILLAIAIGFIWRWAIVLIDAQLSFYAAKLVKYIAGCILGLTLAFTVFVPIIKMYDFSVDFNLKDKFASYKETSNQGIKAFLLIALGITICISGRFFIDFLNRCFPEWVTPIEYIGGVIIAFLAISIGLLVFHIYGVFDKKNN